MTLNDIHMPGVPNSFLCLWLLHQPPDFCLTWHLYLHFVTNPWSFVLVCWMCSHHRLIDFVAAIKAWNNPPIPLTRYVFTHITLCLPFTHLGDLYSLFRSELKLSLLNETFSIPQLRQGSCPPECSTKIWDYTYSLSFVCLHSTFLPLHAFMRAGAPLYPITVPSHRRIQQCFQNNYYYEWDGEGSNPWEWMNNWRNKITNEKQRFSVVQRIKVVWFDE